MTRIAARIFDEVLLVVFLGWIKFDGWNDLRHYRLLPFSRFIYLGFYFFRGLFLLGRVKEDSGAVLSPNIVPLTV